MTYRFQCDECELTKEYEQLKLRNKKLLEENHLLKEYLEDGDV